MKITNKPFIGFLFLTGLMLPLLVTQASTLEEDVSSSAEDVADSFGSLDCAGDYYDFILTVRSANTRNEFIQDFKRGYCQLSDIMELDDELDTVRKNFSTAAYNCEDTTAYKTDYQRILMEQYFIRNVQQSRSDVIREKEGAEFDAAKDEVLTALKTDMKSIFVVDEGRVTEGVFNDYFESWALKYEDRIGHYNQCDEGGFAEITQTWTDFVDTINSLSIDVDKGDKLSFKDNVSVDNDLGEAGDQVVNTGKSMLKSYEYFKNLLNLGKSEVEAPVDVTAFSGSENSYTFGSVLDTLESDNIRAVIESESVERMAKYKLLYGEGGAVAATDMQGVLQYMNQITSETNIKNFPTILSAVTKVYDRECK